MKRALVVLLALVMGAGLLFAADQAPTKWGFYVEGDIILWDQDAAVGMWDGQYWNFGLSYSEADFGFSATAESSSDDWGVTFRNMSGWYKLFNGMLKFTAGKDRVGDYRPTSYVAGTAAYARIANAEWGLLTQVYPVEGLSIGAFVKFPEVQTAQDYINSLGFGVSYAVKDIGTFYAGYKTITDELSVGAKVTALKSLPVVVTFSGNFVTDAHKVNFSTQYAMDALTLSLDAQLGFGAATTYVGVLLAEYDLNKTWSVGSFFQYGNVNYNNALDVAPAANAGGFYVNPYINVNVGAANSLRLGFELDTDGDDAGPDTLLWAIPLTYIMSF